MRMTAVIDQTGALDLDVEGNKTQAPYPTVMEARRSVMKTAAGLAADAKGSVEVQIEDPAGSRTLLVQADGGIIEQTAPDSPDEQPTTQTRQPTPSPVDVETPAPAAEAPQSDTPAADPELAAPPEPSATPAPKATPAPATAPAPAPTQAPAVEQAPVSAQDEEERSAVVEAGPTRRASMPSFVDRPDVDSPAQVGVRGLMNQFGLRLAPSTAELDQRRDEKTVSRHWAGPRTVTVLNPKGGAGKTPTVICLSAVFARLGGSGVLAWDNNNSLGSLGWRTFDAGHEATVVDLLEQTDYFMTAGARAGDLASYVHHQPSDQYDVLRSDDRSGAKKRHEVTGDEVDHLYSVATKYYRLIVMDSGNTERGDNWEAMIGHSDQVVIPVKSVDDAAEGASRVLSALRAGNEHAQSLADRAVVIVLGCTPSHGKAKLNELAESFRPFVKAVATVPYDASLIEGRIRFSSMLPQTRRAWLRAAAQIAEGL